MTIQEIMNMNSKDFVRTYKKAIQEYMKLSGRQRLALMVQLEVDDKIGNGAYESCIKYIDENIQ